MTVPEHSEATTLNPTLSEKSDFDHLCRAFLPEAEKLAVYYKREFDGQVITVDDLTQAALCGLLKARDYDPSHKKGLSFHGYVMCCMRWAIRDYLKPVTRESARIDRSKTAQEILETSSKGISKNSFMLETLNEGRMGLSERQREAIRLRFDVGYKLKEVAAEMEISIARAGKIIKDALGNLHNYMEPRLTKTL
jgi:RNA polymerase sigma factor (sigma-70 family)